MPVRTPFDVPERPSFRDLSSGEAYPMPVDRSGERSLIAELLGRPGGEWDDQTSCMDRLVWLATTEGLSIVAQGPADQRVAFAACVHKGQGGTIEIEYAARLLITDGDIAQWSPL